MQSARNGCRSAQLRLDSPESPGYNRGMYPVLSQMLIPLLMLGHVLPHSHVGSGTDQPDDHAASPHVHLASHDHHHGHSHEEAQVSGDHHHGDSIRQSTDAEQGVPGIYGLEEHDSDAIYLASSWLTYGRPSGIDSPNSELVVAVSEAGFIVDFSIARLVSGRPLRRSTSLPIYLLTASLRL